MVTSQDSLPERNGHLPQKKQAMPWPGFEPTTTSRKSDILTTTPPSHRLHAVSPRPSFPAVLTCFHLSATYNEKSRDQCCVQTGGATDTFTSDFAKWTSTVLRVLERRNSEFVQCVIRLTTDKDRWVDLLCCSSHCDAAESCLTNDTLTTFSSSSDCYDDWRHRPFTTRPMMPAVHSVSVIYYAVTTTCLLLSACCLPLATSFCWHSRFCTMLQTSFPCFTS